MSTKTRTLLALALVVLACAAVARVVFGYLALPARLLLLGYLALVFAGVLVRGSRYTVWAVGLLTVLAPPALLVLADAVVTDPQAHGGLRGLLLLYGAGMVGGLVLELVQQSRFVLEKPYLVRGPEAAEAADPDDLPRPGPKWHLGFLSRLFFGGVAGTALVTLVGSVTGSATAVGATQPGALLWSVVAGSAAPALWKVLSDAAVKRSQAIETLVAGLRRPDQPVLEPGAPLGAALFAPEPGQPAPVNGSAPTGRDDLADALTKLI